MKKRRVGGGEARDEFAANKPTWIGPGTVITTDGANLWVSMIGELWKVAREQCREATHDEKMGIEAVMTECSELVERFKRQPHRAGYKDLTAEARPELQDGPVIEGLEGEPPARRARIEQEDDYEPSIAPREEVRMREERMQKGISEREPEQEASLEGGSEGNPHSAREGDGRSRTRSDPGSRQATEEVPSEEDGQEEPQDPDPEMAEALRRSWEMAQRLDGMRTTGGPAVRWQRRGNEIRPKTGPCNRRARKTPKKRSAQEKNACGLLGSPFGLLNGCWSCCTYYLQDNWMLDLRELTCQTCLSALTVHLVSRPA